MSLLAELKRRNVLRVAALYLAASWLVLQITDVLPVVRWRAYLHISFNSSWEGRYQSDRLFGPRYARLTVAARSAVSPPPAWFTIAVVFAYPVPMPVRCPDSPIEVPVFPDQA